ncbi:MAG: hypothetical protein ACP5HQ_03245 [Thermoprotei archaeon]
MTRDYSEEELRFLASLVERDRTLTELANSLKRSEKTMLNRTSGLKKLGQITTRGKDRLVSLTPLGRLAVKLAAWRAGQAEEARAGERATAQPGKA